MFIVEEMDDVQGIKTKAEFFKELARLDLERTTLGGNPNQAEKLILEKEKDDTEDNMTKDDFFGEPERFDLDR